jgi:predicted aspartyl protease
MKQREKKHSAFFHVSRTGNHFHAKRTMLFSRRVKRSAHSFLPKIFVSMLCASLPLASYSPAADRTDARLSAQSAPQFEALPLMRSRQNHLLVRAFINGKPAWLGVDTGAPVSAIALDRREHFRLTGVPGSSKLPPRLQINGAFNNVAIAHRFQLGSLRLLDEPVVTVDLGSSARAARLLAEQEIDGLLGADILFPTRAVLDCQRQVLILKTDPDRAGNVPGFDYRGLKAMPIHVSDGFNLYVDGSINGAPARLMIDTGAFATLLHRSFVRRMKIPVRETPFSSAAVNLKQRGVEIARIRKLSVGSVDIVGKDVGVIDLEGLIHGGLLQASPPVAGLLGGEILNRHHGVIDFGTRTLYLRR